MNAYEFIKKGFGLEDLTSLNLHIQIVDEYTQYLVNKVGPTDVAVTEFLSNGKSTNRFLGKTANLNVCRILVEPKTRIVVKPKVVLLLKRPT